MGFELNVMVDVDVNGERVRLDVADITGFTEYQSLRDSYAMESDGIIVFFSYTLRSSFTSIPWIIDNLTSVCGAEKMARTPVIIAGSKIDIKDEICVSKDEVRALAKRYRVDYFDSLHTIFTFMSPSHEPTETQSLPKRTSTSATCLSIWCGK